MCGISGIFNYGTAAPVDELTLRRMAASLAHRGPDDEGYLMDRDCGLAFRRLSVIDLRTGHQPILSADGTRAVILNGEIYNHGELRAGFSADGRSFRTHSDAEVVLAAYERHGTACPEILRGMFAFAIWDGGQRRLFLARDRLGVKPLYYLDDGTRLVFGSEIKAILAVGDIPQAINEEAVADYFALRYVPGPKTIFRSIRKMLPGCSLTVAARQAPVHRRYWDVRFEPDDGRDAREWTHRLREVTDTAVRLRMVADVPVGAFLSGGVDSGAVVATMARASTSPVSTFTMGFAEPTFNEIPSARLLAERCRTSHHESVVGPAAVDVIERLAWHFDEPFADSSALPTYLVSKMAREFVTVVLSGDGGDENFAGYVSRYGVERRRQQLRSVLPRAFGPAVFGLAARLSPDIRWLPAARRAKGVLTTLAHPPHEGFFGSMALGTNRLSPLLSPDLRNALCDYRPSDLFRDLMHTAGTTDPVSRAQYVDFKTFLADDILVKLDRASMAVGLEAREPLLDHILVETAAHIPSSMKLNHGEGKLIFKEAMADRLPQETLTRRKQGFETPIAAWLRGPIRDFAAATIFDGRGPAEAMLDSEAVRSLWDGHQSGRVDGSPHLWAVLMFQLWARHFGRPT